MIEYERSIRDVVYHGVISDLGDKPTANWTITEDGIETKVERSIDQNTFTFLKNHIIYDQVFKSARGYDRWAAIYDPHSSERYQEITITISENGRLRTVRHRIPAGEAKPEYQQWMNGLQVPWVKPKPAKVVSSSVIIPMGSF